MAKKDGIDWGKAQRDVAATPEAKAEKTTGAPKAASQLPSSTPSKDSGPAWSSDNPNPPRGSEPVADVIAMGDDGEQDGLPEESPLQYGPEIPERKRVGRQKLADKKNAGLEKLYENHRGAFDRSYERAKESGDEERMKQMDAARESFEKREAEQATQQTKDAPPTLGGKIGSQMRRRKPQPEPMRESEQTEAKPGLYDVGLGGAMEAGNRRKQQFRDANYQKRVERVRGYQEKYGTEYAAKQARRQGVDMRDVSGSSRRRSESSSGDMADQIADKVFEKLVKLIQEG